MRSRMIILLGLWVVVPMGAWAQGSSQAADRIGADLLVTIGTDNAAESWKFELETRSIDAKGAPKVLERAWGVGADYASIRTETIPRPTVAVNSNQVSLTATRTIRLPADGLNLPTFEVGNRYQYLVKVTATPPSVDPSQNLRSLQLPVVGIRFDQPSIAPFEGGIKDYRVQLHPTSRKRESYEGYVWIFWDHQGRRRVTVH